VRNYLRAFSVSLILHAIAVGGIIAGGASISPPPSTVAALDVSVLFNVEEEAAEPPPVIKEPAPPKPKPQPKAEVKPLPKPIPKPIPKPEPKIEPKAEPEPARQVAFTTEPVIEEEVAAAEETGANEAEAVPEPESSEGGASSAAESSNTAAAAEGERLRREYVGKNFAYIQKRVARYTTYPSQARRSGIKGKVTVAFTINIDGTVADIVVAESSGHPVLDDAGITAVRDAAPFPKPPAAARIAIPISFKLI
jgi:protein TonB